MTRFAGAFKASELIQLNNAHSTECALLVMSPASFAVLGWLAEVVFWSSFIEDDVGVDDFDRTADALRWRIYSEMGYTVDLSEQLERMALAQEDMAESLKTSDGEGGVTDIAAILFDLLPILLAGSAATQSMADTAQLQADIACCEALNQPTVQARSLRQAFEVGVDCQSLISETTEQTRTNASIVSVAPEGVVIEGNNSSATAVYVRRWVAPTSGDYTFTWSGQLIDDFASATWKINNLTQGVLLYNQTLRLLNHTTVPVTLDRGDVIIFDVSWDDQYTIEYGGEVCLDTQTSGRPLVAISLNEGIGEIEQGTLMKTARGWFIDQSGLADQTIIRSTLTEPMAQVQLDWTRPFSGTMSINTYNNGVLLNSYPVPAGEGDWAQRLSGVWDELKLVVSVQAGQLIGDIALWAWKELQ